MWEWQARAKLGSSGLIVEADPAMIAGRIRDKRRRKTWQTLNRVPGLPSIARSAINRGLRELRRFDLWNDAYYDFVAIEEADTHRRLADVLAHRHCIEESETYKLLLQKFRAHGPFRHKNFLVAEEEEVKTLVQSCYADLLTSMARDGYVRGKTSAYGTDGIGAAMVWSDGRLWHEDGATHRLVAARLVGVQSGFPLRIVGVHRDFLRAHGVRHAHQLHRLKDALSEVTGVLSVGYEAEVPEGLTSA
jgi:hypothetical protein